MDLNEPSMIGPQRCESDAFVTLPEASRRTRIGIRQFRRGIECGELAIFDIGAWPRVRWSDVLVWIERARRSCGDSQECAGEDEPAPGPSAPGP